MTEENHCYENSQAERLNGILKQEYGLGYTFANKAEASINRSLVALKMLLRYGKLLGLTQDDFTLLLEGPKLWQKLPVICSRALQKGLAMP